MAKKKKEKPTRPCPFCGATANLKWDQVHPAVVYWGYIECLQCGARGPDQSSQLAAIRAWNEGIK